MSLRASLGCVFQNEKKKVGHFVAAMIFSSVFCLWSFLLITLSWTVHPRFVWLRWELKGTFIQSYIFQILKVSDCYGTTPTFCQPETTCLWLFWIYLVKRGCLVVKHQLCTVQYAWHFTWYHWVFSFGQEAVIAASIWETDTELQRNSRLVPQPTEGRTSRQILEYVTEEKSQVWWDLFILKDLAESTEMKSCELSTTFHNYVLEGIVWRDGRLDA